MPKKSNRNGSIDTNPFGTKTMKRLSLEELKAQKVSQVSQNLESIKGGNVDWCHVKFEVLKAMKGIGYFFE